MSPSSARFPNKNLVLGILFLLIGGLLLLWRLGLLPSFGALWPVPFFVAGLYLLYMVLQGRSRRYIFPGMLLTLGSLPFLLKSTVLPTMSLSRTWPVFMLITGLSFLPYGFGGRRPRVAIIVPALTIMGLAVIFLPFSLGLTKTSFTEFVLTWWPTLLLLTGIILVSSHFWRRKG